jgi:hypothetical protein
VTTLLGEPTAGNGGSPTRRRRRGTTAMGERRVRRSGWHGGGPGDGVVREAVGATAAVREAIRAMAQSARWSGRRRRVRGGQEAGGASEAGCRDARHGAWQPRGNDMPPRGPARQ